MSKSKRVELPKNTRVALYCRVACKDDNAIELQKNILQNYAKEHGYTDISVYADNGVSGIGFNRPALSLLEADISSGLVGTVIARSLCRIGRNPLEMEDWIAGIRHKGVSFISVSDGLTDASFDCIGKTMLEAYREYSKKQRKNRRVIMRRSG